MTGPIRQLHDEIVKEMKLWAAYAARDHFPSTNSSPMNVFAAGDSVVMRGFTALDEFLFADKRDSANFIRITGGGRPWRFTSYFGGHPLDDATHHTVAGGMSLDAYWQSHRQCSGWNVSIPAGFIMTLPSRIGSAPRTVSSGDGQVRAALQNLPDEPLEGATIDLVSYTFTAAKPTPPMVTVSPREMIIVSDKPPYKPLVAAPFGEPFRVELLFDNDPGRDALPVSLETASGGKAEAVARRAGDPLHYRTGSLRVMPRPEL
jgi:hypothetical protein